MKLFSKIFLILSFLMRIQLSVAMDQQKVDESCTMLSLPNELWVHIGLICKTEDVSKEAFLAQIMKLRLVCKAWKKKLTDDFIADLVDVRIKAESYQELGNCLVEAVENENMVKIVMIAKLYPKLFTEKEFQSIHVKAITKTLCPKLVKNGTSAKYLKLLLDLGIDPNITGVDRGKGDDNDHLLIYVMRRAQKDRNKCNDKVYEDCIDVLLSKKIDTQKECLLLAAAEYQAIYAMYRLLQCPLHQTTDLSDVLYELCDKVIEHEKLMDVLNILLQRGATIPEKSWCLERAMDEGILPMVRLLLEHGEGFQDSLGWLCTKILQKYPDGAGQVRELVPEIISLALNKGQQPLYADPSEILKKLLVTQADGSYYFGGIHFYPCIKKLLEAGMDGNSRWDECVRLLVSRSDPKLIDVLLEPKFLIHMKPDILKVLYTKYPDFISAVDQNGESLLHHAVRTLKFEVVEYLVAQPTCNVNVMNASGQTPLALLSQKGRSVAGDDQKIRTLLLEHGAYMQSRSTLVQAQHDNLQGALDPLPVKRAMAVLVIQKQKPQPHPRVPVPGFGKKFMISKIPYVIGAGTVLAAVSYAAYQYWYGKNEELEAIDESEDNEGDMPGSESHEPVAVS